MVEHCCGYEIAVLIRDFIEQISRIT